MKVDTLALLMLVNIKCLLKSLHLLQNDMNKCTSACVYIRHFSLHKILFQLIFLLLLNFLEKWEEEKKNKLKCQIKKKLKIRILRRLESKLGDIFFSSAIKILKHDLIITFKTSKNDLSLWRLKISIKPFPS